jgi:ABC-type Mn2+/Zn2+ transport system permease subunit
MLDLLGQPFFQHALVAGTLVGATCSLVGVYVFLRRIVFLGIALAQIASAGVALALLVRWDPLLTALGASVLAAVVFSQIRWRARVPVDAALGVAYAVAAALGTVFVALNPVGEARALTALFGNIVAVPREELGPLAAGALGVIAVHLAFRKELVFVSFDRETATAQGVRARLWDLVLYVTLAVAIALAIRSVGVLVTFALLVIPSVGARLVTARLGTMLAAAVALGTLSVPAGLTVAFLLDLPTGATIALTLAVAFAAAATARALGRVAPWSAALVIVVVGCATPVSAQPTDVERELTALREAVAELRKVVTEQQRVIDQLRAAPPAARIATPEPRTPPPSLRGRAPVLASPLVVVPSPLVASERAPAVAPPAVSVSSSAPASPPPLVLPSATAPAEPSREATDEPPTRDRGLPPWLALLPEVRVEGNLIGNYTLNQRQRRKLERQLGEEGDEFFVRRNRLNVREVELGLRSAVDPFARFEAIVSAEQDFGGELKVGLEEGFLTSSALPGGLHLKLGKFRTGFGEFNDSDPEEIPQVDPPNVIRNVFGRSGEGWLDTGLALTRRFGVTDDLSFLLWGAAFNGDNEAAFHGGRAGAARRPAWFGRLESFLELAQTTGLEGSVGFAEGRAADEQGRARLRSRILSAHLELQHHDPLLALYRGLNLLGEFFYTWRDRFREPNEVDPQERRETLGRFGLYTLGEARIAREWSLGARFDYSQLPTRGDDGPPVRHETGGSFIVSFRPSRFLTLRAQYTRTARNFALDSDEIFLQALFKLGFERPGAF